MLQFQNFLRYKGFLIMKNDKLFNVSNTVILILIAFLFSVAMRLVYVHNYFYNDAFKNNGQYMINTNDGYYFAEGARDLLNNGLNSTNMSSMDQALSILTVFIADNYLVINGSKIFYFLCQLFLHL